MITGTDVLYSPGWYFKVLFNQLGDHERRTRLELLHRYRSGNAPLPRGADNARAAFEAFVRQARTNFADLIVGALAERIRLTGFLSAREHDETGDPELGSLWARAGMAVVASDTHKKMFEAGESYVIVGEVDEDTDAAVVTHEDPRFCIGLPDPDQPRRLIAALKIKHFPDEGVDRAYLHLAGKVFSPTARAQVWVAKRKSGNRMGPILAFNDRSWEWEPARSGENRHDRITVVRFDNENGMGEFEQHTDILDRINHQILLRLTIAVLQAFRQRAVMGLPTVYPKGHPLAGQLIDYEGVFTSDPAAVWQLPAGSEMWESAVVDLNGILNSVSADVQQLASVSRTPLHMMMPAGTNQSAEGANLQREALTFKATDRIDRVINPWAQVTGLMLMQAGATDRKALAAIQPLFANPELLSLAERADAAAKAANDIPRRSRLIKIWQFRPDEVDRMETEWAEERLLQEQMAQALAAATPVGPNAQQQPAPGDPGQQPADQGRRPQLADQPPPPQRGRQPVAAA